MFIQKKTILCHRTKLENYLQKLNTIYNNVYSKKSYTFSKSHTVSKNPSFSKSHTFFKIPRFFQKPILFQKTQGFLKKADLHSKKGLIISLIDPDF